MAIKEKNNMICVHSICVGDVIIFTENVWGPYSCRKRKPPLGERTIKAVVEKESYGQKKQQHTFSLRVLYSDGYNSIEKDKLIRRKGRNIYSHDLKRMKWEDEMGRDIILEEKHFRGDKARKQRDIRRVGTANFVE